MTEADGVFATSPWTSTTNATSGAVDSSPGAYLNSSGYCHQQQYPCEDYGQGKDNSRLDAICEEDSDQDSGSWWSYPSECGSVIEACRSNYTNSDLDSLCASLESEFSVKSANNSPMTDRVKRPISSSVGLWPARSPERVPRRFSNGANGYGLPYCDDGNDTDDESEDDHHEVRRGCNQVGSNFKIDRNNPQEQRKGQNHGCQAPSIDDSINYDRLLGKVGEDDALNCKERRAGLSNFSNDSRCHGNGGSLPSDKHKLFAIVGISRSPARRDQPQHEASELDDSGYLDGESTSSSSDLSPPNSLGWQVNAPELIDTERHLRLQRLQKTPDPNKAAPAHMDVGAAGDDICNQFPSAARCNGTDTRHDQQAVGAAGQQEDRRDYCRGTVRDSAVCQGRDFTNHHLGFHHESSPSDQTFAKPHADSSNSHAYRGPFLVDFALNTRPCIVTECSYTESVRTDDRYEYKRNGTTVLKFNNLQQNSTSWTDHRNKSAPERMDETNAATLSDGRAAKRPSPSFHGQETKFSKEADDDEEEGLSRLPPAPNNIPVERGGEVSPSARERPNYGGALEQEENQSYNNSTFSPSEVEKKKEAEFVESGENSGAAVESQFKETSFGDDDTRRELSPEQNAALVYIGGDVSSDRGFVVSGAGNPYQVRATATSRAIAHPHGEDPSKTFSSVSALASARAEAENPYLALAAATARAAATASVEASNEFLASDRKRKEPDFTLIVSTACSVSSESLPTLREDTLAFRERCGPGVVVVGNRKSDDHGGKRAESLPSLPKQILYKEFSDLSLASPVDENDMETVLSREPVPAEHKAVHVHSGVLPSRKKQSAVMSPVSPPRIEEVRKVTTPVKGQAVIVNNLPEDNNNVAKDCSVMCAKKMASPVSNVATPSSKSVCHNGYAAETSPPRANATNTVQNGVTNSVVHHQTSKKPPLPVYKLNKTPPRANNSKANKQSEHSVDYAERITGYKTASQLSKSLPKPQYYVPANNPSNLSSGTGRLVSSRRRFFESLQRQSESSTSAKNTQLEAKRRFDSFRSSAQEAREVLAKSSPDLAALEADVRSRRPADRSPAAAAVSRAVESHHQPQQSARSTVTEEHWSARVGRLREVYRNYPGGGDELPDLRRRSKSLGYLETDVDTLECREVKDDPAAEESPNHRSSLSLDHRAHSMDFLMQEEGRTATTIPENNLCGGRARAKSEHELRIERSLQNLHLPEWYTRFAKPKEALLTSRRKATGETQQQGGWQGLGSRTPSATSLTTSLTSGRNLVIPKRVTPPDWRYVGAWRTSRESLSSGSPGWASPHDAPGSLSRWGSVSSAPGSAWSYRSFRQPYLGWRAAAAASTGTPSSGSPTPFSRPVSPGRYTTDGSLDSYPVSIPRDRYSYIQSIYGGGWHLAEEPSTSQPDCVPAVATTSESRCGLTTNKSPSVWMESSFVGAKPAESTSTGQQPQAPKTNGLCVYRHPPSDVSSPTPPALGEYVRSVGITL